MAAKVNWQFKTKDARIKLRSLYTVFTTSSWCYDCNVKYQRVITLATKNELDLFDKPEYEPIRRYFDITDNIVDFQNSNDS